jgi:hypothetical protein
MTRDPLVRVKEEQEKALARHDQPQRRACAFDLRGDDRGRSVTVRFGWRCDRCRKRGSLALPADIDAWGGSQAVLEAHRVRSPRCRGDAGTVRVTLSKAEAQKNEQARRLTKAVQGQERTIGGDQ